MNFYVKVIEDGFLENYILPDSYSVSIPDNIHTVGSFCFSPKCLPENHEYYLQHYSYPPFVENWANVCKTQKIIIGKNVEFVSVAAFVDLPNLLSFEVEDGCRFAKTQDGVLFTANGKDLIAFPAGLFGDYVVPQGTETIWRGAFEGTQLSRIVFPDGVKYIDDLFYYATSLREVYIPESVTQINECAFEDCPDLVIKAPAGSFAIEYAISERIAYEEIDPRIIEELARNERREYWALVKGEDGKPCRQRVYGYAFEWNGFTLFSSRFTPENDTVPTEQKSGKALCEWSLFLERYEREPEKILDIMRSSPSVLDYPEKKEPSYN